MIYKSKKATRDGRSYFFRIKYRDVLGVQHDYASKKYLTKKEATLEEAKYKLKLDTGDISVSGIVMDQVFSLYVDKMKKELKPQSIPKMITCYNWLPIKQVKINDLNYSHIKLIYDTLDKGKLSADYKNKILGLFKRLIKFSTRCYGTSDKILSLVDTYRKETTKKEMEFFTLDEYNQFYSVIDNQEYKVFFDILYFLGLRKSEVLALTWNDIDLDKATLSVTKNITRFIDGNKWQFSTPKTKNSIRVLPIPNRVLNGLKILKKDYMKYKNFSNDWLIFGITTPYGNTTICNIKNKYCKMAGVKQIRIHDFRHSCASLLINKGASIQLVSKYLGHSNINITLATYTHLYQSELEDIKKTLDTL